MTLAANCLVAICCSKSYRFDGSSEDFVRTPASLQYLQVCGSLCFSRRTGLGLGDGAIVQQDMVSTCAVWIDDFGHALSGA